MPWITRPILFATAMLVSSASAAQAHVAERAFVLLLPSGHYMVGGSLAVAATFAMVALVSRQAFEGFFRVAPIGIRRALKIWPAVQWAGFVIFCGLLAMGFFGSRDPLGNLLPLTVWTLWWVGFTFLTALFGDLWRWINPFSAPYCVLVWALGRNHEGGWRLPDWLGVWPAIVLLFGFGWFELVDLAPDDPARLAWVALGYWAFTLLGMLLFGENAWLSRCDCFTVFFRFVAQLAVVRSDPHKDGKIVMTAAFPGARLCQPVIMHGTSKALFILLALATVTFDGLNETFWWFGQIGINPLEFPGRSAVVAENTLGLLGGWAVLGGGFALAAWVGDRMADGAAGFRYSFARLALSLMPIALAYHFAHYLTVMMINGQYALVALSDPFDQGRDFLGLGEHYVTTSFLNHRAAVEKIWLAQSGAIVAGHIVAVLAAHRIALDLYPSARQAVISQIPLGLLMVGYTLLGLWLLASPTA